MAMAMAITIIQQVIIKNMQVIDSTEGGRPRSGGSDHAVLRINLSHCLLFCLQRVSRSNRRSVTQTITNIFQKYDPKIDLVKGDPRVQEKIFVSSMR